ncbi:zinc finger BED domain-containing protein 4-like [Bacillus rossius redtenbacheri]|uniref:zinc finger BED domain-containing protein 4-like n=1 Tax=Bacillus rossius redtenbacheri TaxID=93214 RepID=UPI002FDCF6E0
MKHLKSRHTLLPEKTECLQKNKLLFTALSPTKSKGTTEKSSATFEPILNKDDMLSALSPVKNPRLNVGLFCAQPSTSKQTLCEDASSLVVEKKTFQNIVPFSAQPSTSRQKHETCQPTLAHFLSEKSKFKPGDKCAEKFNCLIAQMICLDQQPFSIVENVGFRQLVQALEPRYTIPTRKTFSNKLIPEMYSNLKENVKKELEDAKYIGITTDLWTSTSQDDYLSITVHFIDNDFSFKHYCIEVKPFLEVSHTASNLCSFLVETITLWGLQDKVVAVVTDNGRNVVAALSASPFEHISCFAHTLQLVLKDAFLNSKLVSNLTSACRRIVGHFKHSSKNCKILAKCQNMAGLPNHRLIQDEPTRWNSTLHMLKRLVEQKQAVILACSETNNSQTVLNSSQWTVIDHCISVLEIFNNATLQVSSANSNASEVSYTYSTICEQLLKHNIDQSTYLFFFFFQF